MDFRQHVRAQLPSLGVRREPEIVDEIAEHLSELYEDGRSDGLTHDAAFARACAALPDYTADFVRELRQQRNRCAGERALAYMDRYRAARAVRTPAKSRND